MKVSVILSLTAPVAGAFVSQSTYRPQVKLGQTTGNDADLIDVGATTRRQVLSKTLSACSAASVASFLVQEPAFATGRATLDRSYERYAPRILAGGEFYGSEFKGLVLKNDWPGIKNSLQEVPDRKKEDLQRADAGVAARARQAGKFSDARVLVAADLFASAFSSQNSITPKTKKMKAAVEKLRAVVQDMQITARQALGEESSGGLFGFGAKKPDQAELSKKMRGLYVEGGNAWNEYIFAANDDLALQFDRFPFLK